MKRFMYLLYFVLSLFFMEIVFKFSVFDKALNINIIYIFLISIFNGLIFYFLSNLFNKKFNKFFGYLFIIFLTILFISQFIYYKAYLSFFSIYMVGEGVQVFEFIGTILKLITNNIFVVVLLLLPLILFIFLNKFFCFEKKKINFKLLIFCLILVFYLTNVLYLNIFNNDKYSNKKLYYNLNYPYMSVNKLGLFTYMRIDIKRLIFGFEEKAELIIEEKEEIEEVIEYNIMDIEFDRLIENEKNDNILDLHNYFKNVNPTNKNEYTGIFENYNLIYLMGESFHPLAVDEELTPTLYKLVNNGFVFNNYYVPTGNTTDGEFVPLSSILPKAGGWSMRGSKDNYMPFVLGNVFKNYDYHTTAFHNHTSSYYSRNLTIPNYGFEYYACYRGLNINCKIWPESDVEMVEDSFRRYIDEDKFLTYYITVSGHLNYTTVGNMMAYKNWNYVKDLEYSNPVKSYLSCNKELDLALELLLNTLEEKGILDNTVIAMTADHYPYGLTIEQLNEKSEFEISKPFELHRNNLVLYNSKMEKVEIDKYVSNLDVLPTLLNLFNVEYDSRLLMGKDVFSDNEGLVIMSNRSFITDKGKYDSVTNIFESFNEDVDDEYIENIKQEVFDKYYVSTKILDLDYYKYVFEK